MQPLNGLEQFLRALNSDNEEGRWQLDLATGPKTQIMTYKL